MNRSVSRQIKLAVCFGVTTVSAMALAAPVLAETKFFEIKKPSDARLQGLESLHRATQRDGGVPLPPNLSEFIKDRRAALQLGKALFWDMQVGSDGVQACASCHFHAGADDRSKNALNPALRIIFDDYAGPVVGYFNAEFANAAFRYETRQANETVTRADFPFVKSIQEINRTADGIVEPARNNSNDIAGSMGMFFTQFSGVRPGSPVDAGTPQFDPVFNVHGRSSVRRVEPRNTPSVINAVFNLTNFWDGRAAPVFNGRGAFGHHDREANILVNRPGVGLVKERIAIDLASLASQSMQPPSSPQEMSFDLSAEGNLRTMPEIGAKLLRPSPQTGHALTPLGLQKVHRQDSVLGALANSEARGLSTTYEALIKKAFAGRYWNSAELMTLPGTTGSMQYSQMEANFSLFFGLAVLVYQSTLVADRTPFDQWMESGRFNKEFDSTALAGLNLFVNQGQCVRCHAGPELTAASVRAAQGGKRVIRAMAMADGSALYDNGFYNTSVTPSTDDAGRGDLNINDQPLASSRQALFNSLGVDTIEFPILGGDSLPAQDEDTGAPVCNDSNANGVCDPDEAILPAFQRVAVDGAFKTPGLRNSELTGPYFHNGGMATLRQVVQFYNRGGNFCRFNLRDLDPAIAPLGMSAAQEEELVAFLVALTDTRVKYQRAPFDHPELRIPEDGLDIQGTRTLKAVGANGAGHALKTFLELDPQDAIYTPVGICTRE
ncbi:MAG: cytochrome C peroxidase [Gammaproteobacteria bacterium]|nr:cytochrome C peroxidase [Gammaproteobacteria bacterium]